MQPIQIIFNERGRAENRKSYQSIILELEKFKFVLDYKIKELKKQIEPGEQEIPANQEHIHVMESMESMSWSVSSNRTLNWNLLSLNLAKNFA